MPRDLFSDALTRLRNALRVNKQTVIIPFSNLNYSFSNILLEEHLLEKKTILSKKYIKLEGLKFYNKKSDHTLFNFFKNCQRLSKPSNRLYIKAGDIPLIDNGLGFVILSTSYGLMTGKKARALNIGGELLCQFNFQ
uniref:Small ribosomal subunit protein uS8c n=1 Tax=Helicosporidium sp. subsp. Simulium jonesii TaxID=145475 RepID=RR8_HELSJ|nr:ribosomal protein S8 [Helicosporidium sp. ex Simulium jonesi]Q2EEW4.1 RecName: Full=Small ribosomal subunit protein uS8c; AltName: Full=30S ribosomal protein S8, plastid [Helicosporidium sp. ex Simulium jonesi]ABD33978.1 ribosomal protein S8 [Helicosporidium sp. ex Simulium jonesi]